MIRVSPWNRCSHSPAKDTKHKHPEKDVTFIMMPWVSEKEINSRAPQRFKPWTPRKPDLGYWTTQLHKLNLSYSSYTLSLLTEANAKMWEKSYISFCKIQETEQYNMQNTSVEMALVFLWCAIFVFHMDPSVCNQLQHFKK